MHHFQGRPSRPWLPRHCRWAVQDGDAWVVSFALFMQALAALERGDYEQATALLWRRATPPMPAATDVQHGGPLLILANIAVQNGDYDRAQQLYDEAIDDRTACR